MSNSGPRQPDEVDETTAEPERVTPVDDGAASPAAAVSPDSDAGTEEQQATNAAVLEVLLDGGLTIDIRIEEDEFLETPIGRAVDTLYARGALTEGMAKNLKTIYEASVARIGEAEQRLKEFDQKAREIIDPANDMAKIADLEAQLDEGDFVLDINRPDGKSEGVSFLDGIFHYRQGGSLNAGPAIRLAKKCIAEMLKRNYRRENIIDKIEWIHTAGLINDKELRELLDYIITDPAELEQRIASAVDLSLDGEEEGDIPPEHDDDGKPIIDREDKGPEHDQIFAANPNIARARGSSRLAFVIAGILLAGGATTAIYTSRGRSDAESAPTATAQRGTHLRRADEEVALTAAPARIPSPATAAAPASTTTPQVTQDDLTGAPPLMPIVASAEKKPRSITLPVTIKQSGSGNLKIDTADAARAVWINMGYTVSVSMGLNGKIIRLTDDSGNVYQVAAENLTATTTELSATLQPAQ